VTNGSPPSSDAALPDVGLVWLTFGVVVLFSVVSAVIYVLTDPNLHLDLENFAVFAPVYAAAQALERLLEPIASRFKPSAKQKDVLKAAKEQTLRATDQDQQVAAAAAQQAASDALRKRRSERALIYFAVASCFALVLTGVLGLGILQAMATEQMEEYLRALDVVLTGLVIGAGTKPLHDLVTRLEKSKENADSSTEPTTPTA
jgi:hypothetical protein